MKKVSKGMRYDTQKALWICDILEGAGRQDFRCINASLYRTPRSSRYFIAGYGGAMTVFAKTASDGTSYGSKDLIPLTREQALKYAEEHATVKQIEDHFTDIDDA